ncbi:hypothetical protein [Lacrimispora sp.]|uniref:hypothetical protein n=1 Tax=Lacrimispora sp. TaxID=2719234 RepID=UPI0032E50080
MVLNKKFRCLSGVLTVVLLVTTVPVCVYGETGELFSTEDRDAASISGWVGNIDFNNNFDFSTVFPQKEWYQYNQLNLEGLPSPKDLNDNDGNNDIIEYCTAYGTNTAVGKIYKDYILNTPGYYDLKASVQVFPYMNTDKGTLRIELYDNETGSGEPVGSSYEVSKSTAGISTGFPAWETVTVPVLYVKPKVKMIRVVLEAEVTYPGDAGDYVNFDGLSVTLTDAAAPPIISNLDGDTVSFTEGGSAVPLDKDSDATVKVDSAHGSFYTGGSVTASITSNIVASEDVLEIAQTGGITLSESNVLYNGTSIGTYSGGTSGTGLTVLLNIDANDTNVAALIKAITYKNINLIKPDIKPRTIKVAAVDNLFRSEPVYATVNVQGVNYAPVRKSNVEASKSENLQVRTPFSVDLSTIFEDPDTDSMTYKVKINDASFVPAASSYSYTPSTAGTYTLVFMANDGTVDSSDTYTVTLTAVNTAPVRKSGVPASKSENVTKGNPINIDLNDIFEDADHDVLNYKVKVNGGAETATDGLLTNITSNVGPLTLEFIANDGIADSDDTYTLNLNVKAANTPPVRQDDINEVVPENVAVNKSYTINLNTIFQDNEGDYLTYKVKVNGGLEETTEANYSFKPTSAGTNTLEFRANDGSADSTETYTVILKAVNTVPNRKIYIGAATTENITVNSTYTLDLSRIFEDENLDTLNYKVKVDGFTQTAADKDYTFVPNQVRTYTLEFTANDGTADSTDTYKVTLNVKAVNTPPERKSGVSETVADSVAVQKAYSVQLNEIFEDVDHDALTYKVIVNGGAEETADASYSYKPTTAGTTTLVFSANDGSADSTDTYTVTLTALNTIPVRKSGVEAADSATIIMSNAYTLDLSTIFEDENKDALSYKVKVNEEAEKTAARNYSFTPTDDGTYTLVFTANDGTEDSTDTYTVTITATKNALRSIKSPAPVTRIANGTAKTASALGLPEKVTLMTDLGEVPADINWKVEESSYDPDQKAEQTFDVEGTVILPDGVYNPDLKEPQATIQVTVNAEIQINKVLESISALPAVTGVPNGTAKIASALGLPEHVNLETDNGPVSADVTWEVADSSYDPDRKTEQSFTVDGKVKLPVGVINPNNIPINVTIEVTVDAESATDKILEKIYPLSAIKGITNGTAKTVTALGIPAKVTLGTDYGNVQADVVWDLDSSAYDPLLSEEQSFTVEGTVVLPDNVMNPSGIPLDVIIHITVLEEQEEQEYYTLRIKVTKRPDKVSYTLGEDLDTQGLEVTEYQKASPSNAIRKTALTEGQYDLEYNLTRTGTRTVKVIYYAADRYGNEKEFTDDFTVTVKELPRDDSDDDDREITEPGKRTGGDDDHYYPGNWQSDENGWKIIGKDGSRPVNRWVYTDWKGTNDWYFFDENGYMVTGWFEYKGSVYYLNPVSDGKKGSMYTGWNMIDGKWYYFSEAADATKGSMLKDTVTPDGHRVGPNGERIS